MNSQSTLQKICLWLVCFGLLSSLNSERSFAAFQPSAPYYTTFFYPWYQNPTTDGKWSQWSDPPPGTTIPHTPPQNWFSQYLPDPNPVVFDPASELYSSNNDQIIYWQLRKLAEAKQEVAIASWWGQTHKTNTAFSHIIKDVMNRPDNPYPNLRWGIYYEKEGFADPPVDTELVPDLEYIIANFTNQPAYFKINGRPVIFVYNAAHPGYNPLDDLARWQQAKAKVKTDTGIDLYIVMKRDPLDSGAATTAIDSWHEYAPAARTNTRASLWFSVSPGFWLNGNAARLTRDRAAFEAGVRQMVAATTPWKITETWNEWGEGSGVEPADAVHQMTGSGQATIDTSVPFKNGYIDILARNLPALEAGTGSSNGITPSPHPTNAITDPVIAAAGDIACGSSSADIGMPCKQAATAAVIATINPSLVLPLGDNQYEAGSLSDFQTFYQPTWGKFKAISRPIVGNHEYGTTGAKGYFDYFNGVNVQAGPAGDRAKGYYSYDTGNWHMIALNGECDKVGGCQSGSAQEQWLQQDLAAHPSACTLAYWHEPRFSSGFAEATAFNFVDFWQDLYAAHADIVLNGHAHYYERYAPSDPQGNIDRVNGIREFIVGTGGRDFNGLVAALPNSEIRNNTTFGVLKLTLHAQSYDWQFVPISGQSFTDAGTTQCHGSTQVTPTGIPGTTKFATTILLHGIGKSGDNVNPTSTGNTSPLHPQRTITFELFNVNNQLIATKQGSIAYNATTGNFQGEVAVGTLPNGIYTVRSGMTQYLKKTIPGIITVTSGQTIQLPTITLTAGDSNGDNMLSILDYNMVLDCFSDLSPARNCSDSLKKMAADLTDDGIVNQFDYNLFLRELSVQIGQ